MYCMEIDEMVYGCLSFSTHLPAPLLVLMARPNGYVDWRRSKWVVCPVARSQTYMLGLEFIFPRAHHYHKRKNKEQHQRKYKKYAPNLSAKYYASTRFLFCLPQNSRYDPCVYFKCMRLWSREHHDEIGATDDDNNNTKCMSKELRINGIDGLFLYLILENLIWQILCCWAGPGAVLCPFVCVACFNT